MGWTAFIKTVRRVWGRQAARDKPPLSEARAHADAIVALLYRYWRDKTYRPSAREMRDLQHLETRLFEIYGTGRRLIIRLERRFHGEPEIDVGKWRDWRER